MAQADLLQSWYPAIVTLKQRRVTVANIELPNCQMLWIDGIEVSQAATFSSLIPSSWLSSSVTRIPSLNLAPSSTSATSSWPLTLPPAFLGGGQQLVGHRERGGLGAGALGHPGPEPDGRERALDRVGCPQVLPVLSGEVVERGQLAANPGRASRAPWGTWRRIPHGRRSSARLASVRVGASMISRSSALRPRLQPFGQSSQ